MEFIKKASNKVYNSMPNIRSLPEERYISDAASAIKQTPFVKDIYFNNFNPLERTYLETNFISDKRKIDNASALNKIALKGVRGVGQFNDKYDKIQSTPGVKEQYDLYKSNLGGKKRRKTRRKTRRVKTRRHTKK
jgi:hypothetical protein